jgi:CheY-like chemotaxis protein
MHRILAADDDMLQLELRKRLFEGAGHEVVAALTTQQTAREMKRGAIDLVVMDLRFPNAEGKADCREGLQLIRWIREMDSRVPILVLSGAPQELEGKPEEQMVSRVIMKPVKAEVLLRAARELLRAPS